MKAFGYESTLLELDEVLPVAKGLTLWWYGKHLEQQSDNIGSTFLLFELWNKQAYKTEWE